MNTRIRLPPNEDPVLYTMTRVGSPRLLESRVESWGAQYFNDSTVTPREREAMRMRGAHQMSCTFCTAFRGARDLEGFTDEEIPEEFYENVFEYKTWPGYTERERLAIEFMERFMLDYQDMADDVPFWDRMQANFNEVELFDLCHLAGQWDWSAKMFHLLVGIEDGCRIPTRTEAATQAVLSAITPD